MPRRRTTPRPWLYALLLSLLVLPSAVEPRRVDKRRLRGGPHLRRQPILRALPGPGQVIAGRFLSRRYAARGPRARGGTGDYFVRSRRLLAVLRAADGSLTDLAIDGRFEDRLGWAKVRVCDSRGVHDVVLQGIKIVTGARPAIEVRGAVFSGPPLEVTTSYHIPPGGRHLVLVTRIANRGASPRYNLSVCDHMGIGNTRLVVPGIGEVSRPGQATAGFCGKDERGVATILAVPPGRSMRLRVSMWPPRPAFDPDLDVEHERFDLAPGKTRRVRRVLAVARGGLHRALAEALRATAAPRREARVAIAGGAPAGAALVIRRGGKPYLVAATSPGARTAALVLERGGDYSVSLRAPGAGEGPRVALEPGEPATVTLPPRGSLKIKVLAKGAASPAKLIFTGAAPPRFGSGGGARAGNVVYTATGEEEIELAPGRYDVTATRGPAYSLSRRSVRVRRGKSATLTLRLRRVIPDEGWSHADLHVHGQASFDSPVSHAARLASAAAVGLHMIVATDHHAVTDPAAAAPRAHPGLIVIPGQEVTTEGHLFGHFNIFPLTPGRPLPWENTSPGRLFRQARGKTLRTRAPLIQVNHPRMGTIGYFNQVGLDAGAGRARAATYDGGYDLLEVFNGDLLEKPEALRRNLADWFALLRRGGRYVATGGSDSHRLPVQDAGYPRNLILWRTGKQGGAAPSQERLLAALRAGRSVITTGPAVRFTADGRPVGSVVERGPDGVSLRVRVLAAPWVDVSKVTLLADGEPLQTFVVRGRKVQRLDRTIVVRPGRDTWYVVQVEGKRPDPTQHRKNVLPFAVTNPIWIKAPARPKAPAKPPAPAKPKVPAKPKEQ